MASERNCLLFFRVNMKKMLFLGSKRVWYVLLINALLHAVPSYDILAIAGNMGDKSDYRYYLAGLMGVTFLAFSFFGWVAEVFQRYSVLTCSIVLVFCGFLIGSIAAGIIFLKTWTSIHEYEENIDKPMYVVPLSLPVLITMIGFGMFEANALRFGTDQLTDASSEQHNNYVRWYYWVTQLGPFLVSCMCITAIFLICQFEKSHLYKETFYVLAFASLVLALLLILLGLFLFCTAKKHLEMQNCQGNPFKLILAVLKYTWHHKCPERRSAFTYWENDVPPRFDLGKGKYGGPFTDEEVESVKSFLLIFLVLCTLFGYQIAGDTFSVSQYIKQYGCPSPSVVLLFGINPQQMSYTIALVAIPLSQFCQLGQHRISMLKKMGIGLLCSLLQEIASTTTGVVAGLLNHEKLIYNLTNDTDGLVDTNGHLTLLGCYVVQVANVSVTPTVTSVDVYYGWLVIPQLLGGIAQLLVFMTALEFISAQGPYALQGILIGVWYSMYFINFLLIGTLDTFIISNEAWYIYHGIKIAAILASLILYCCVAKWYKQRERNEVFNYNFIIEEAYEKMLQRREDYDEKSRLQESESYTYGIS